VPELPEVQTTVNGINRELRGLKIVDVWTDYFSNLYENHKQVKSKKFFTQFKKDVSGTKIVSAERRAKNILINLSNKKTILVHMKMTGHLLYGRYKKEKNLWKAVGVGPLRDDSYNQFIHLVFSFSNGRQLALSDVRKFAKVTVLDSSELREEFKNVGPEPLVPSFSFVDFDRCLEKKPNGKIKQVLMDQSVIAGIGNIYSDEILWASGVNPLKQVKNINLKEKRLIFQNLKVILKKGIKFKGDSLSDYRNLNGEKGKFQYEHKAYQKTGERCSKKGCKGKIVKIKIGGRSAHFCSIHQK